MHTNQIQRILAVKETKVYRKSNRCSYHLKWVSEEWAQVEISWKWMRLIPLNIITRVTLSLDGRHQCIIIYRGRYRMWKDQMKSKLKYLLLIIKAFNRWNQLSNTLQIVIKTKIIKALNQFNSFRKKITPNRYILVYRTNKPNKILGKWVCQDQIQICNRPNTA